MNDTLVATSRDTCPYSAYLMTLLSYGCDAKDTWLKCLEGWQRDEDEKYDAQENIGLISRQKMISNSRLFDFMGQLYSDMLLQEWLVPNNMNVCLLLLRSWPAFHLMDFWPSRNLMCALRRPSWRYTRSRPCPQNSCAWKRSWPLQGPNTR